MKSKPIIVPEVIDLCQRILTAALKDSQNDIFVSMHPHVSSLDVTITNGRYKGRLADPMTVYLDRPGAATKLQAILDEIENITPLPFWENEIKQGMTMN